MPLQERFITAATRIQKEESPEKSPASKAAGRWTRAGQRPMGPVQYQGVYHNDLVCSILEVCLKLDCWYLSNWEVVTFLIVWY